MNSILSTPPAASFGKPKYFAPSLKYGGSLNTTPQFSSGSEPEFFRTREIFPFSMSTCSPPEISGNFSGLSEKSGEFPEFSTAAILRGDNMSTLCGRRYRPLSDGEISTPSSRTRAGVPDSLTSKATSSPICLAETRESSKRAMLPDARAGEILSDPSWRA